MAENYSIKRFLWHQDKAAKVKVAAIATKSEGEYFQKYSPDWPSAAQDPCGFNPVVVAVFDYPGSGFRAYCQGTRRAEDNGTS